MLNWLIYFHSCWRIINVKRETYENISKFSQVQKLKILVIPHIIGLLSLLILVQHFKHPEYNKLSTFKRSLDTVYIWKKIVSAFLLFPFSPILQTPL